MYRQGVSALIINNKNEVLLVNLTTFEEKYYAIPGGGLEDGEAPDEAIFREIKEELGIDRLLLKIISKSEKPTKFDFKSGSRIMHGKEYVGQERLFFLVKFLGSDSDIQLAKDEVRNYIWSSRENLSKYLLFESQHETTMTALEHLS